MQRVPVPIAPQQLGTAASGLYSAGSGITATVANLSLTNTSASPASVTIYNVPSGATPDAANTLVSAFWIPAGQTYVPPQAIGLNLAPGGTLQALASTAGAITAQGGAYETSGS